MTEEQRAFIEILAIASRSKSTAPTAHNPSDEERLKMIERIAKNHVKKS